MSILLHAQQTFSRPLAPKELRKQYCIKKTDFVRFDEHNIAAPAAVATSLQRQQQQKEFVTEEVGQLADKVDTLTSKVDLLVCLVIDLMGATEKITKHLKVPLEDEDEPRPKKRLRPCVVDDGNDGELRKR